MTPDTRSHNIDAINPQVTMENAVDNQIHLSQSVPMSSPLTWKLTGDIGEDLQGRNILQILTKYLFRVKPD